MAGYFPPPSGMRAKGLKPLRGPGLNDAGGDSPISGYGNA